MTKNQIDFRRAQEDKRHNLEQERLGQEHAAREKAASLREEAMMIPKLIGSYADYTESLSRRWKNLASVASMFS